MLEINCKEIIRELLYKSLEEFTGGTTAEISGRNWAKISEGILPRIPEISGGIFARNLRNNLASNP